MVKEDFFILNFWNNDSWQSILHFPMGYHEWRHMRQIIMIVRKYLFLFQHWQEVFTKKWFETARKMSPLRFLFDDFPRNWHNQSAINCTCIKSLNTCSHFRYVSPFNFIFSIWFCFYFYVYYLFYIYFYTILFIYNILLGYSVFLWEVSNRLGYPTKQHYYIIINTSSKAIFF